MIKLVLTIIIAFLGGIAFKLIYAKVKSKLVEQVKSKVTGEPVVEEKFDIKKFVSTNLNIKNAVLWAKDFASIFNARKLIMIGVVLGMVYGYAYWKGQQGIQPVIDGHGQEVWISINEHFVHIRENGTMAIVAEDRETVLKEITVKDVDGLKELLKPYGVKLEAFVTAGGSMGTTGTKGEAGIGLQYFKWFKWYLNVFATNVGLYPAGVSYKITKNSDILAGYGMGYEGDQRVYLGWKWRF